MEKIKLNESDLKSLIERVMNENEGFNLSTEGKLEFIISSLKDIIHEAENESDGKLYYYMNRVDNIIKMVDSSYQTENITEAKKSKKFDKVMHEFGSGTLKTPNGDKVTDKKQAIAIAYSESGLDEARPGASFDAWADLETNGAHRQGITNRGNFTRKENAKEENIASLNTPGDYRKLILQWGKGSDESAEQIFNSLVKKYRKGIFTISDLNQIAQFGPIEGRVVTQMLSDFVNKEGYETGYYSDKNPSAQSQAKLVQQPR